MIPSRKACPPGSSPSVPLMFMVLHHLTSTCCSCAERRPGSWSNSVRGWWSVRPAAIQRSALACVLLPLELSIQPFDKLLRARALQQAPLGPEDPRALAGMELASPGGKQGSHSLLTSADSPPSAQPGALPPSGRLPLGTASAQCSELISPSFPQHRVPLHALVLLRVTPFGCVDWFQIT